MNLTPKQIRCRFGSSHPPRMIAEEPPSVGSNLSSKPTCYLALIPSQGYAPPSFTLQKGYPMLVTLDLDSTLA